MWIPHTSGLPCAGAKPGKKKKTLQEINEYTTSGAGSEACGHWNDWGKGVWVGLYSIRDTGTSVPSSRLGVSFSLLHLISHHFYWCCLLAISETSSVCYFSHLPVTYALFLLPCQTPRVLASEPLFSLSVGFSARRTSILLSPSPKSPFCKVLSPCLSFSLWHFTVASY